MLTRTSVGQVDITAILDAMADEAQINGVTMAESGRMMLALLDAWDEVPREKWQFAPAIPKFYKQGDYRLPPNELPGIAPQEGSKHGRRSSRTEGNAEALQQLVDKAIERERTESGGNSVLTGHAGETAGREDNLNYRDWVRRHAGGSERERTESGGNSVLTGHAGETLDRKTTSTIAIGYDATLEDPSESVQRVVAIASSLDMLAKLLDRKTTSTIAIGYDATLEDLTQEEIVLAFSRAHDECKFFPSPATLREFSGRPVTGDPIANEAKEGLLSIIAAMRGPHGPMLRDIPGRILYGTEDCPRDAEGKLAHLPIREPGTPFLLSRRLSDALVRLGWGDRSAGIAVIADHPAVSKRRQDPDDDDQYKRNQLRAADEILKRFTDAYREV